jgi:hypothetical protein
MSYLILTKIPKEDYSLKIVARRDDQYLFIDTGIMLANTAKSPLTNINVDYELKNEKIALVNPGGKN